MKIDLQVCKTGACALYLLSSKRYIRDTAILDLRKTIVEKVFKTDIGMANWEYFTNRIMLF